MLSYLLENGSGVTLDDEDAVEEVETELIVSRLLTPAIHVLDQRVENLLANLVFLAEDHEDGLHHLLRVSLGI